MIIHVKKRKAGSYRDLAFETYEIGEVNTVEELLVELTAVEIDRVRTAADSSPREEIGKISFTHLDGKVSERENAVAVMKQDFTDGLFRVFFNEKEYTRLDEALEVQAENELVLIRLVMMAGRLW